MFNGENSFECMNDIDINIKNIYFFIKIVEYGNLSKAAEKLYVSQPYLSKTMKNLEERLGFDLFIRENNRLSLSSKGREFYKTFRPQIQMMHENIERIRKMDYPVTNIGVQYTIDFRKLQDFGLIKQEVDYSRYNIEYRDFTAIIEGLNDSSIDCAVILSDYLDFFLDYENVSLGKIRSSIIVSPENKFADCESVTISDVEDEEFVFYSDGDRNIDATFPLVERYCKKIGIRNPKISFAVNYQTALFNVLTSNKVIIGEELRPDFPIPELISVPFSDQGSDVIVIFNDGLSEEKKDFIEELYN